jgi:DNA-binding Lrp family transcriptional regulator
MTGKPQTRYELVEGLGTSVTTVNRVIAQLEKAGAIITREIGSDGRQAVFRLVEVTAPKGGRPYLHIGDRVRVVAAHVSGDDMLIDTTVDKYTYRGVLRGVVTNVNIGGYATVQAVERVDDTLSNVRFEAHGSASGDRMVVLESVRNITET